MSDLAAFQATVHGIVQGVNFRAATAKAARDLGVTGWVRNTPGGDVELYAEGVKAQLEKLETYLRRGPPRARVEQIDITRMPYTGGFPDFSIKY